MDSIEKQALRIEETLRKLGFKDILIERIRDEKCEWRPNREISISLEPKSPSLPDFAEIFKENSVWHLSFGSFGFHASDELFTLFLESIVNHLSEDKSISQEIIDGLEDEWKLVILRLSIVSLIQPEMFSERWGLSKIG